MFSVSTAPWFSSAWLRPRRPPPTSYKADLTQLALQPCRLDAVASFYVLGHIPSRQHAALFVAVAAWLRPGGLLFVSAPLVADDYLDPDWLGVPMFFGGIGEKATRHAVTAAGLEIERWEITEEDEGDGKIVSFLWLMARQRPDDTRAHKTNPCRERGTSTGGLRKGVPEAPPGKMPGDGASCGA